MMAQPFIKNEQLNYLRKQIDLIKASTKKNVPPNVLEAVISFGLRQGHGSLPDRSVEEEQMLDLSKWRRLFFHYNKSKKNE